MNLEAAELAESREDFAALTFSDLLNIMRPAVASAADKGEAPSGADEVMASGIPCRIGTTQQKGSEGEVASAVKSRVLYQVFTPFDSYEADATMYLVITSQGNRVINISGVKEISQQLARVYEGWAD